MTQRFCTNCGGITKSCIPPGDNRERAVCHKCGTIHYDNPKMVVGCIIEQGESILLCKRAIEPRKGLWTIPAGYMENGESSDHGALRETMEESGARVEMLGIYRLFDLPHINQSYIIFRARLLSCPFTPTPESSVIRLFHPDQIPWRDIAFTVVTTTLQHYLADRNRDSYSFAQHVLSPNGAVTQ